MTDQRVKQFRHLHESGCFVMPNPWDVGSTRYLESLGFPALATTSAGAAWSLGYSDNQLPLDAMLEHIASIVAATQLPLNADFGNGYSSTLDGVAENVRRCVATGVAGLSIEDSVNDGTRDLFDFDTAVSRVAAARAAIDASGTGVLLTARAECFLTGHDDARVEAIARLTAYAEAGADVLYAPGPLDPETIGALVDAVRPKPVNALVYAAIDRTVADYEALGVRRISLGGAIAKAAWAGAAQAAAAIAADGSFAGLAANTSAPDTNALFRRPR